MFSWIIVCILSVGYISGKINRLCKIVQTQPENFAQFYWTLNSSFWYYFEQSYFILSSGGALNHAQNIWSNFFEHFPVLNKYFDHFLWSTKWIFKLVFLQIILYILISWHDCNYVKWIHARKKIKVQNKTQEVSLYWLIAGLDQTLASVL